MNFTQKLQKIQEKLNAPKNQHNKFGNFDYRSFEDILEAVKPILSEYEMVIKCEDNIVQIGDRYYVQAVVSISDGSDSMDGQAYAREPMAQKGMNESQITGSASSYARKYAISGLLAIDDNKDPDGNGKSKSKPKEKQNEIVEMAFLAFEAKHQSILTEESFLHFEFDREMFEKAIIKEFKALPTNQASIPKIVKTIKPEEVLKEKEDANTPS